MTTEEEQQKCEDLQQRRAAIFIGEDYMRRLFQVPDDVYIRKVHYDEYIDGWYIHVYSDRFPKTTPGTAPYQLMCDVELTSCEEHGFQPHIKINFPSNAEEFI